MTVERRNFNQLPYAERKDKLAKIKRLIETNILDPKAKGVYMTLAPQFDVEDGRTFQTGMKITINIEHGGIE
jgi:hypothetical protein